jgi:small subunit ribosomal protein S4
MGDPKFARKHYTTPPHPWDGTRISEENQIIHKYGLKNKRELWKTETMLREIRQQARELQARQRSDDEQAMKEVEQLMDRLKRLGLLHGKADLNDVLGLEIEAVLSRRLQTQTYMKGLARTVKQARQLIVHGHITVDGRKVTVPSYLVKDTEAGLIEYHTGSPFVSDMHPERPAADFHPEMTTVKEERRVAAEKERDMRRSRELERIERMRRQIRGAEDEDEEGDEDEEADIEKVVANGEEDDEEAPEEKGDEPKSKESEKADKKDDEKGKGGDS